MSNVDSRLKNHFEEYDSSAPLTDSFDEKEIERILSGTSGTPMPQKITAFCKVVSSVESAINARLSQTKSNISSVNLSNNLTISSNPNDPEYSTKIMMTTAENGKGAVANIALNVNVQKMLKLPAERVYAALYALVESSVFDKILEKEIEEPDSQNLQSVELVRNAEEAEKITGENSKENKTLLGRIIKYIMDGLRELFGANYPPEKLEAISKNIARDYSSAYGGTAEVYSEMFDTSKIKRDPTVQELKSARRSKILTNAENAADSNEPGAELSYREQATALLSEDTRDAFEQMKVGGAPEMQSFAESYISDYLQSNGVGAGDVEVVFVNNAGAPKGLFRPGDPAQIIVNLNKMKDSTDMVMTITHESKHAVDSIKKGDKDEKPRKNDIAVKIEYGDYGLIKGTPEFKFVKKLNAIAYHIDPNERRGRMSELAGLRFMQSMAGDDPEITEQVERNIAGFNKYQKDTIKAIDGLNSKTGPYALETLEAEFSALGGLSLPENLRSAIRAKIEYIKDRMEEGLDATSERGSIDNTVQIAKDLKGRDLTEQELEDLQMQ